MFSFLRRKSTTTNIRRVDDAANKHATAIQDCQAAASSLEEAQVKSSSMRVAAQSEIDRFTGAQSKTCDHCIFAIHEHGVRKCMLHRFCVVASKFTCENYFPSNADDLQGVLG